MKCIENKSIKNFLIYNFFYFFSWKNKLQCQDLISIGSEKTKAMILMSSENLSKEDTEIRKLLIWSFKWIKIGEKVNLCYHSVRYNLDGLKKEWNEIQDKIKNKKKANK